MLLNILYSYLKLLRSLNQVGARGRAVNSENLLDHDRHLLYQFVAELRYHSDTIHFWNHMERAVVWVGDVLTVEAKDAHCVVPMANYCLRATPAIFRHIPIYTNLDNYPILSIVKLYDKFK